MSIGIEILHGRQATSIVYSKVDRADCRECITKFYEQVRGLGRSLQCGGSGNLLRDTAVKIRWQISEKEDLAKFSALLLHQYAADHD